MINVILANSAPGPSRLRGACAIIPFNDTKPYNDEAYPNLAVLITLGSAGSIAYRVEDGKVEIARQEAFRVRAVDTTAAGDTFTGYFIGGLLEDKPLQECMRRASMASTLGLTRPGAAGVDPNKRRS